MQRPFQLFCLRFAWWACLVAVSPKAGPVSADDLPKEYTLKYPRVTRVVPPVRTTFYEVTRTVERVNGKTFRHPLNGGFGVALGQRINGKKLLHCGADLSWYRVGAPVFAIADGVVRISRPSILSKAKKGKRTPMLPPSAMLWGNFIVIEHRLKSGEYVTTLYGHLGDKRLVKPGDIVKAGQQIGEVGRQSREVNGGYIPHLHFGVKPGRMMEIGRALFPVRFKDKTVAVRITELTPQKVGLDFGDAASAAGGFSIRISGKVWHVESQDGKYYLPATMLWSIQTPAFPLVGYQDSTKGWEDPIQFLRKHSKTNTSRR